MPRTKTAPSCCRLNCLLHRATTPMRLQVAGFVLPLGPHERWDPAETFLKQRKAQARLGSCRLHGEIIQRSRQSSSRCIHSIVFAGLSFFFLSVGALLYLPPKLLLLVAHLDPTWCRSRSNRIFSRNDSIPCGLDESPHPPSCARGSAVGGRWRFFPARATHRLPGADSCTNRKKVEGDEGTACVPRLGGSGGGSGGGGGELKEKEWTDCSGR